MAAGSAVVPRRVRDTLTEIGRSKRMRAGVDAMLARKDEFDTPLAAKLAGVAAVPEARRHFDDVIDEMWASNTAKKAWAKGVYDEVVIGAGLHAAIYCAVRVQEGFERPLVIEAEDRAGGAFAVSRAATFYLNSRNRPGKLSVPGRPGALNVLPGAVVQPSDLSGDEYQRNSDLAFAIRATLASSATVCTSLRATKITPSAGTYTISLNARDKEITARRVVIATGLGAARRLTPPGSRDARCLTFGEFMERMDVEDFPLRGMDTVAVVGAGDSGKTAIEALTGQGPACGMSVASLDRPSVIDWYGCAEAYTRERWEECNRSRYKGIGRVLREGDGNGVVRPIPQRAIEASEGYECAYVNECPYDYVIDCTGFLKGTSVDFATSRRLMQFYEGNRPIAMRYGNSEVYVVGPTADFPVTELERSNSALADVPENSTSLFRYADRTAKLAAVLPVPVARPMVQRIDPSSFDVSFDLVIPDATASLGLDKNDRPIFVGSLVTYDGGKIKGRVVGCVDDFPDLIGAVVKTDTGVRLGGYGFKGEKVYGLTAGLWTVIDDEREFICKAQNGDKVFVGDTVEVKDSAGTFAVEAYGLNPNGTLFVCANPPGLPGNTEARNGQIGRSYYIKDVQRVVRDDGRSRGRDYVGIDRSSKELYVGDVIRSTANVGKDENVDPFYGRIREKRVGSFADLVRVLQADGTMWTVRSSLVDLVASADGEVIGKDRYDAPLTIGDRVTVTGLDLAKAPEGTDMAFVVGKSSTGLLVSSSPLAERNGSRPTVGGVLGWGTALNALTKIP